MATARGNRCEHVLRDAALAYPETHEDFPWPDHRAIKVRGKMFVILSKDGAELSMSVKLPWSAEGALQMFPFCEPTGYGMGRSGWITASFGPKDRPPLGVLRSFIDESYRSVAPKRIVAGLARTDAVQARPARRAARPRRGAGGKSSGKRRT
jgi:predicted DNA-binding protein (MmcQ/YjbR family)